MCLYQFVCYTASQLVYLSIRALCLEGINGTTHIFKKGLQWNEAIYIYFLDKTLFIILVAHPFQCFVPCIIMQGELLVQFY